MKKLIFMFTIKENFLPTTSNVVKRSTAAMLCTLLIGFCLFTVSCEKLNNGLENDDIFQDTVNISNQDTIISNNDSIVQNIDFSNIKDLYAQPLSIIQKCVQGKWQKKGEIGGVAGWMPERDTVFVEINENRLNGYEFQWKEFTVQNTNGTSLYTTYAIQYIANETPSLYFGEIRNDSLYVGYALDLTGCYDCITGALWVRMK